MNPEIWLNKPSTSQAKETISAEPSVVFPAKRLSNVFNDIIKWPEQHQPKSSKKNKYTSSVITLDKWIEFHEMKTDKKLEKEKKKKKEN